MHLNLKRTKLGLQSLGFEEIRCEAETFETFYARPNSPYGLAEWVQIAFQGRDLEYPLPYVAISPVRKGALVKGLVEILYVDEMDKNSRSGKAKILNDHESRQWEQLLIENVPQKLEKLTRESAGSLLQRTDAAREAVRSYFRMLDRQLRGVMNVISWYQTQPLSEKKSLATQLSKMPGVCNLSQGRWLYEIAIFVILIWCNEVEGKEFDFHDTDPLQRLDPEFVFRKELIVDEIIIREDLDQNDLNRSRTN
jgi:hypothetical protein